MLDADTSLMINTRWEAKLMLGPSPHTHLVPILEQQVQVEDAEVLVLQLGVGVVNSTAPRAVVVLLACNGRIQAVAACV